MLNFFRQAPEPPASERGEERVLAAVRSGGARVERVVFTRNRRVMASVAERGRTLRLHESFETAPERVLVALGTLFSRASRRKREAVRQEVRHYIDSPAAVRFSKCPGRPR